VIRAYRVGTLHDLVIWKKQESCMHSTTSQDMHVKQNVSSLPFTWFREMDLLRTSSWHLNECRPKRTHPADVWCMHVYQAKSFYKKLAPALHTCLWMYGYKAWMHACVCVYVSVCVAGCEFEIFDSRAAQIRTTHADASNMFHSRILYMLFSGFDWMVGSCL